MGQYPYRTDFLSHPLFRRPFHCRVLPQTRTDKAGQVPIPWFLHRLLWHGTNGLFLPQPDGEGPQPDPNHSNSCVGNSEHCLCFPRMGILGNSLAVNLVCGHQHHPTLDILALASHFFVQV